MDDISRDFLLYGLSNEEIKLLKETVSYLCEHIEQFSASVQLILNVIRGSYTSLVNAWEKIRVTPTYQFLLILQRMKEEQRRRAEMERIRVLLKHLAFCYLLRKNLSAGNRTCSTPKEIRLKPG